MLKTQLVVETIGKPMLEVLSESEQRIFFETLFSRIFELYRASREQQD